MLAGMSSPARPALDAHPPAAPRRPDARTLARGPDWAVSEYHCHAGPGDRPYEEQHARVTVAAVVAGSFTYSTDAGRALMHPGSFLLGNAGACFECGHDHGTGDRCLSVQFDPEYFAEIAASAAGTGRYRFPTPMLPVSPRSLSAVAALETLCGTEAAMWAEETVASLAAAVLSATSGHRPSAVRVRGREERRIADAVRLMERHVSEPLTLDGLARAVALSKFHFLRSFRSVIGVSPYQYLLSLRMRLAARRLVESAAPVAAIAFDAGFGDLSTFNRRFRRQFGVTPHAYRRRIRVA